MNDAAGKTVSSLAITEKKPHKPGGCVGIFFQLFDWKRRFAKKKLFSKKLLPPARPTQISKKFPGDEKRPILRLIAEENSGGFPNVKKNRNRNVNSEQKFEPRAPSLVARLMGLESLPPVHQDKLKKASVSESGSDRREKFVNNHSGSTNEDLNLEKGNVKHELRPQKLQKTGVFERQPVTRFGAEALPFKSVLARSRKHHPKLASPMKSPRMFSGRNASRFIDAATKILEPGLQATNRVKCALTYSNILHHALKDDIVMEGTMSPSPDPSTNSNCYATSAKAPNGQSSCKNCGNLLDLVDSRPNVEEQSPAFSSLVSSYVNPSSYGSENNNPRQAISSPKQEQERVLQKSQEQSVSLETQARDNIRSSAGPITNRKSLNQGSQIQCPLTNQQCKSQRDVPSSIGFKHKSQSQIQMSLARDRIPPRSKSSNLRTNKASSAANAHNETKNFVAVNRSLSGRTGSRLPAKVDQFDAEKKSCNRRDESLSPVRKRRSAMVSRQGESSGFVSSGFEKQRIYRCDAVTGKGMRLDTPLMNHTCIESRLPHAVESNRTGGKKDNDIISFTFSSPMKRKIRIQTEMEEARRDQNDDTCNSTPQKSSDAKTCFQNPLPWRGDYLGALLEQILKELTCQEVDELATGSTPKRTNAMIFQELIAACTAESPVSQDEVAVGSDWKGAQCDSGYKLNTSVTFQAKTKTKEVSGSNSHDCDHHSPGSVLEASFLNDSCFSGSLDDNSDILDSATSLSKGGSRSEFMTDLLNYISGVLDSINRDDARLKGIQLAHAKEVILNAELVFGNGAPLISCRERDFSVSCFLLNELDTLAGVMRTNSSCFLGFEDTKAGNQLRGFLLDCVIEYLDLKYGQYSKSGFKSWTRLPLCMNVENLISEVIEEVRRWTGLARLIPDELIEREMSYSLGKWTDFEIETFEISAEIDKDIFQTLVDEIVTDLWHDRLGSAAISYRPY